MIRIQPLLACVLTILVARPSLAQGDVQLTLGGLAGPHGALLELSVTALDPKPAEPGAVQAHLRLFLAPQTSSRDALALLNTKLTSKGIPTLLPGTATGPANLFILDAIQVRVRGGQGFYWTVATCDGPPAAIRFERAVALKAPSTVYVGLIGRSAVDGRTQSGGLIMDLDGEATAPSISNSLRKRALESGWLSDRPQLNTWRPIKLGEGLSVVGCSVSVRSEDPWWIEVGL